MPMPIFLMLKELYLRRELIRELVSKELKIHYSRPLLRFLWAFLLPFLTAVVFYFVFSKFLKVEIREAPGFLYLMTAIFPWRFFQDSVMTATTCLIDHRNLLRESAVPYYFIPVSIVIFHFVNFLPSLMILLGVSLFVLKSFSPTILFLPLVLLLHLMIAFGLCMIFSVFYVRWRDTKYLAEFFLMLIFYSTPVFYSLYFVQKTLSPGHFSVYLYNPFTVLLNLYRYSFFGAIYAGLNNGLNAVNLFLISFAFSLFCVFLGLFLFKKYKDRMKDHLAY
jgi:ABC-type polysaccharide/polyol phosphate export permease